MSGGSHRFFRQCHETVGAPMPMRRKARPVERAPGNPGASRSPSLGPER